MTEVQRFEAFMIAYKDMVYTTSVRLLGNEAQAKDISQEVFLKAYQHFAEIGTSPTAGGWLKTTATHLCLNHITRYRNRWRFFSEMTEEEESNETFLGMEDRPPNQQWEEEELKEALGMALQKLPDHQRIPIVLFHIEEMSYEEIARRLKISLSKLKTDLARGRARLRQLYQPPQP